MAQEEPREVGVRTGGAEGTPVSVKWSSRCRDVRALAALSF
jgi:hypothetical protein